MGFKDVVTAQQSRVQTAGRSRACTACIDTRGSLRIASQVIARPWPAVLEDAGSSFPLGRQGGADRVAHQVANVTTKIQAGQGAAHLGLRAEQCRDHTITPRAASRSANAESTDSSWSASRTSTVVLS